jgi:uncharacterized protein (TIGR03437 family)
MVASRTFHNATLLNDGRVLLTGGLHSLGPPPSGNTVLASAELYTPTLPIPAPALFSTTGDGQCQGAIWHAATGAIVSGTNPATTGEVLSMYTSNLANGGAIPPQVIVGGRLAKIFFFGSAPGYPGYYQVNFQLPDSVVAGSSVPVRLTYLGRSSNQTGIAVQ